MFFAGRYQGRFQYPLADRLGFWGASGRRGRFWRAEVSVSSGGSTWFLGLASLADGGLSGEGFSILWRIDLVFGAPRRQGVWLDSPGFSILWRIDLVFGGVIALA